MKRFFFIATMAIMAIGCQKTEIQNEVFKPIGFNTEVGKQTRAIATNGYYESQPFAVYAYGWQNGEANDDPVMDNVEIYCETGAQEKTESTPAVEAVWKARGAVNKYYWPNDPETFLNFYAYSPAWNCANTGDTQASPYANHQKLTFVEAEGNGVSHDEDNGLKLTNYVHNNMYVDFMVATPVLRAKYSDQAGDDKGAKSVPVEFSHKFTQVNFTVKIAEQESYPDVDFAINSITLNAIPSQANYVDKTNTWTLQPEGQVAKLDYVVYPATTLADANFKNNAEAVVNTVAEGKTGNEVNVILRTDSADRNTIEEKVIDENQQETTQTRTLNAKENPGTSFNTTPVTMIPQNLAGLTCTIVYTVSGTGVATETITKTFNLANGTLTAWAPNMSVRYTLTMSLNEITFSPSVTTWDDETDVYYDFNDNSENGNLPSTPAQGA